MGFNDHMHPKNIYRNSAPDFRKLADKFEYFRKFTKETNAGRLTVNFKDPAALRALTCALLENDFGIKLTIPVDRLIPTVPLRLNYILWIEDLLNCLHEKQSHTTVRGFDIGTGASCIYPLLGAKINGWHFLASEVDVTSLSYALDNVRQNGLDGNIKVKKVEPGTFLQTALKDEEDTKFDFCMCNPPFFVNEFEAFHGIARSAKRPQPTGVCTGTETETVTGGGEVEFVKAIIRDSIALNETFRWYTTMLGKKSSLVAVLGFLRANNIHTVTTTEFCQGRTMRWGVAWSFLPDISVEGSPPKRRKHAKKAKPLRLVIPSEPTFLQADGVERDPAKKVQSIVNYIKKMLKELKVSWQEQEAEDPKDKPRRLYTLQCNAEEKTWAHQRRKRRQSLRKRSAQEIKSSTGEHTGTDVVKNTVQFDSVPRGGAKEDDGEEESPCEDSRCDRPAHDHDQVSLPSAEDAAFRLSFAVRIEEEFHSNGVVLEMEWVEGKEKNDLYQLFQFFQNKILKGL